MYYFPKDDFYPVRLFKLALPDPCDFIHNNNERSFFWHHSSHMTLGQEPSDAFLRILNMMGLYITLFLHSLTNDIVSSSGGKERSSYDEYRYHCQMNLTPF